MVIKMKENKLVDLSMDFAVKIMKTCEHIKGHYSINNQLQTLIKATLSLFYC